MTNVSLSQSQVRDAINSTLLKLRQRQLVILSDMDRLSVDSDESKKCRKSERSELSETAQKILHELQNPKDCHSAKKLLCSFNEFVGFGAYIHLLANCLIVALDKGRVMLLQNLQWDYGEDGFQTLFGQG